MHIESKNKVTIRNTVIGGSDLLICVPLVATGLTGLVNEAQNAMRHQPDILEWRVDAFARGSDRETCLDALTALRCVIEDIPLIFTCRSHAEGGFTNIPADRREDLIAGAIQSGYIDMIDIELSNEQGFIRHIHKAVKDSGLNLILSYHNFKFTPESEFIIDTLVQAQDWKANIAKVAVMPQRFEDVITLMSAVIKAKRDRLNIPMIAISMGALGSLTRIAGGLFGSDISFASSETISAPGQIAVQELRQAISLLNFT